jgi:DNA-binding NarL/FixJ family response regulator
VTKSPWGVLIADDHPIVREGLRAVLAVLPDFELVGEATTGTEAVTIAQATQPHLVVMDLHMPEVDGVEATRQLVAANPSIGVMILTMHDDEGMLLAAVKAGARGYLLKGSSHTEIAQALRAVVAGGAAFGPGIADRVLLRLTGPVIPAAPFPQLTRRELEVLALLAQGKGNQDIAHRLWLSPKTVRNHVANIVAKLEVGDRFGAIVLARDAGLGQDLPE